jgi:hypothetical protein
VKAEFCFVFQEAANLLNLFQFAQRLDSTQVGLNRRYREKGPRQCDSQLAQRV